METILEIVPNRAFFQVRSRNHSAGIHMNEGNGCIYHYHNMDTLHKPREKIRKYFGPVTLATIHRHCALVDASVRHTAGRHLYYTNNTETIGYQQKRTNAIFLTGCYLILRRNWSPEKTQEKLQDMMVSVAPYTDMEGSTFHALTVLDCWRSLYQGIVVHQWFQHREPELDIMLNDGSEDVMNWIVPGKLLAMEDPKEPRYMGLSPKVRSSVIDYFKQKRVETVVRLNSKDSEFRKSYGEPYDSEEFVCRAIKHYDLFFRDGGVPSDSQLQGFLRIIRKAKHSVAVHCHAGRGRTGTMIACALMRFWGFDAVQAIAWVRICRCACVVGIQQDFVKMTATQLRETAGNRVMSHNSLEDCRDKVVLPEESKEKRKTSSREGEIASAHLRVKHPTTIKRRNHTKAAKTQVREIQANKFNLNNVEKVTLLPINGAFNGGRRRRQTRQRTTTIGKSSENKSRVLLKTHRDTNTVHGKTDDMKKDDRETGQKDRQKTVTNAKQKTRQRLDMSVLKKMHPFIQHDLQRATYLRADIHEKFGRHFVAEQNALNVSASEQSKSRKTLAELTRREQPEDLTNCQIGAQRSVPYELKERTRERQEEHQREQTTKRLVKGSRSSIPFVKPQMKYTCYQPTFEHLVKLLNFQKESKSAVPRCSKEYKSSTNCRAKELTSQDKSNPRGSPKCKNVSSKGFIKAERRLAWQDTELSPQYLGTADMPAAFTPVPGMCRSAGAALEEYVEKGSQRQKRQIIKTAECNGGTIRIVRK